MGLTDTCWSAVLGVEPGEGDLMTELVQGAPCPICSTTLRVQLAQGRKSGKPFVMLVCSQDGRHFRGFINHQPYVQQVLELAKSKQDGLTEGAP